MAPSVTPPPPLPAPVRVAFCYALIAAAWIFLSDRLLGLVIQDAARISHLQTAKGWLFVLVSALFLYSLVRHYWATLRRRELALEQSEERFRSVFLTAAAGMVVMRLNGTIIEANPAFCAFVGYDTEALQHLSVHDLTHPDDRTLTEENYRKLIDGQNESIHYEKRFLTSDGRTVWGHASVACLLGRDDRPPYCIGLVQDISRRKQAEEVLLQTNRELEAFTYTVSHDLRSPLTPIVGYADWLKETCRSRLTEQELQALEAIAEAAMRMSALMDDLLDLAKTGRIEHPADPVAAAAVVDEIVRRHAEPIARVGLTIRIATLPELRVPRTLLSLLFDNLIGNAVRYGCRPGGAIEIEGKREGSTVRFCVRDHGPGIPAEERGRIFEVFYRGTTGKAGKGTGIGLATVQKIARLYAGRAWVEETPGGGSTFWVEVTDSATVPDGQS